MIRERLTTLLPVGLAFCLAFPLIYLAPLQSDDFAYALKGVSVENWLSHYLSWSGRLLADIASSTLLSLRSKVLVTVVNTTAVLMMVYFIAALPFGKSRPPVFALNYVLIFVVYWIGNPALGQTTLWAVGAANYVYANALVAAVLYLVSLEEFRGEKVNLLLVAPLAFLAGIGNENMSVAMGFVAASVIGWRLWQRQVPSAAAWVATLAYGLGSAVLILAPGNMVRQTRFGDWYALPMTEKFAIHFLDRVPSDLPALRLSMAVLLVATVIALASRRDLRPPILFVAAAGVSVAAMAAAPYLIERSLNPTLVLLLMAISFLLPHGMEGRKWRNASLAMVLLLLPWSVTRLVNQYEAYISIHRQQEIREQMIRNGGSEIPAFYARMLINPLDGPDRYHNDTMMGRYYGTGPIAEYKTGHDYASGLAAPE